MRWGTACSCALPWRLGSSSSYWGCYSRRSSGTTNPAPGSSDRADIEPTGIASLTAGRASMWISFTNGFEIKLLHLNVLWRRCNGSSQAGEGSAQRWNGASQAQVAPFEGYDGSFKSYGEPFNR